ncbi:MAG: DUF2817 domain-containing protein [Alphaproteobacteria bacterium]|nr:DUF2817 domain-containing protein [Alphaproteobacteria bacterium]
MNYYSEDWYQATEKFTKFASKIGTLKHCRADGNPFEIPYLIIGNGPRKVVINSGVHGIEGYFGSAAQNMFLDKIVNNISKNVLDDYTIVLIHVINAWGMQNRMREVQDVATGGLVDLNRNFGVDFSDKKLRDLNPLYSISHPLLLSKPDKITKTNAIRKFRREHLTDGAWAAISRGQYYEPYGLFYGGTAPTIENRMTTEIYDDIMTGDATSLTSIGFHTGLGRFYRRRGTATAQLLVSHPTNHQNTMYFKRVLDKKLTVVPDDSAQFGPTLLGDLVDFLETRFSTRKIPVRTADFEIGTGEFPIMSPVYKRMDMGDARYDLLHNGKINDETWKNLTESWYPSDEGWKNSALNSAQKLFDCLLNAMQIKVL